MDQTKGKGTPPPAKKASEDGGMPLIVLAAIIAVIGVGAWTWISPKANHANRSAQPRTTPAPATQASQAETPHLEAWDPVAVNHTRQLKLDEHGVYTMKTVSVNPPIFGLSRCDFSFLTKTEIENFLSEKDCAKITEYALTHLHQLLTLRLAAPGWYKSDHTYLDGSNIADKDKVSHGVFSIKC